MTLKRSNDMPYRTKQNLLQRSMSSSYGMSLARCLSVAGRCSQELFFSDVLQWGFYNKRC